VEAQEQGKGVGAQLLEYILDSNKNLETLELTVNRQNYKAINFYFKSGFVIKEVADFDIGEGYWMNDFVMTATSKRLHACLKKNNHPHNV
jgi:ribosomal protein S18 acetylase RimI-like enzyme